MEVSRPAHLCQRVRANIKCSATPGIDVQSNIGLLPAVWVKAVVGTFLTKSTDAGALNQWIQSALAPTFRTPTPKNPSKIRVPTTANPVCTGKTGA